MIIRNHLAWWWGKEGAGYGVTDDIRFVTGRYRGKVDNWTTCRSVYALSTRYGLAFRFSGDWNFLGYIRLSNRTETREEDAPLHTQSSK